MKPSQKLAVLTVAGLTACIIITSVFANGDDTAQQLAKANAQRLAATKEVCATMATIYQSCLNGSKAECDRLNNDSIPWFQNEFGAMPIEVCTLAAENQLFRRRM
jgi:cytochrome bd-type quinol oxidase subunit 1